MHKNDSYICLSILSFFFINYFYLYKPVHGLAKLCRSFTHLLIEVLVNDME